ncbi:MAG: hypothetical protein CME64_13530 [Halobacteriovoraceae bacterium]|nr:hypothetical protein [Halobacteriovoraceae bacterium]
MRLALSFILLINVAFAAKSYDSFLVSVGDQKITVISPKKINKNVTIVVENKTFDKVISEIRTSDKVLKRFTLFPSGRKDSTFTVTIDFSKANTIYYAPVSPPFQAVPLTPSKGTYEIP